MSTLDAVHEAAGFTGRFTAGLRYVESTCVSDPLISSDPLAGILAGDRGLALAKRELEQLSRDQGPGKHLRVPARSRLIDDMLEQEIHALLQSQCNPPKRDAGDGRFEAEREPELGSGSTDASAPPSAEAGTTVDLRSSAYSRLLCQVVSLGAGMCTRPWRLAYLAPCRVFEVDLPHIAALKEALLAEAGAQTECSTPEFVSQPQAPQPAPAFPLLAASYACIGVDLSSSGGDSGLATTLVSSGFDPAVPTIWILEALLYYMPIASASAVLSQLAALSAVGSRLIATCVDWELLEASLQRVSKEHVFADLWHFEAEALLYDTWAFRNAWQVDWTGQSPDSEVDTDPDAEVGAGGGTTKAVSIQAEEMDSNDGLNSNFQGRRRRRLPGSTRRLAAMRLGADTYVALYGGSELLFTAGLRQQGKPSSSITAS